MNTVVPTSRAVLRLWMAWANGKISQPEQISCLLCCISEIPAATGQGPRCWHWTRGPNNPAETNRHQRNTRKTWAPVGSGGTTAPDVMVHSPLAEDGVCGFRTSWTPVSPHRGQFASGPVDFSGHRGQCFEVISSLMMGHVESTPHHHCHHSPGPVLRSGR